MALDDALVQEGDAWLLRLTAGMATREDADALQRWRGANPKHEEAFREAVRLRSLIRAAGLEMRAEAGAIDRRPVPISHAPQRVSRRTVLQGAIAASVAGAGVLAGGWAAGVWPGTSANAAITTRKGERRTIVLAQGISAELNTQTSIALRSINGASAVELLSGEVALMVEPAASQPLTVLAGAGRATAEQARFNVRCEDGAAVVACLDGSVLLEAHGRRQHLGPGHKIAYDHDSISAPEPADTAAITAWSKGMLVFRQALLSDVVAEINRYRPGRIILADSRLAKRRIDGTFYIDRIDDIFDQLRSAFGADVARLPGNVVVLT